MAVALRYLGWSAFEISMEDGRRLVLDPVLTGVADEGVPPSPAKLEEFDGADFVLVTHAAGDHIGQAFEILGRSRARLICDVATRFLAQDAGIAAERIYFMAPGVEFEFDGLRIKALPAEHLSFRKIGEGRYISAPPLSYLVTSPGNVRLFLGGDTSISANHRLFGQLYRPHVAVLGVGGVDHKGQSFTELYPDEAALVAKWFGAKVAIPIHYRFDEGTRFAQALKKAAPRTKAVLLAPGQTYTFPPRKRPARGRRRSVAQKRGR
jgi:L-ascorbate metabolism protein UlaG (beta-lactamase superfamily)